MRRNVPVTVVIFFLASLGVVAWGLPFRRPGITLIDIVTMSRAEAESVLLGKPTKDDQPWEGSGENAHPSGEHLCEYKPLAGTVGTQVDWRKDGNRQITLTFPKTVTWQKAAQIVGLNAKRLRYRNEEHGGGMVTGHGLKGFEIYYSGYLHKNRSNGFLSNEAGHGLPQLVLFPK